MPPTNGSVSWVEIETKNLASTSFKPDPINTPKIPAYSGNCNSTPPVIGTDLAAALRKERGVQCNNIPAIRNMKLYVLRSIAAKKPLVRKTSKR